jgi:hypothetical protein
VYTAFFEDTNNIKNIQIIDNLAIIYIKSKSFLIVRNEFDYCKAAIQQVIGYYWCIIATKKVNTNQIDPCTKINHIMKMAYRTKKIIYICTYKWTDFN